MRCRIIVLLFLLSGLSFAQTGKIVFDNFVTLEEGVYFTFHDILRNSPRLPGSYPRYHGDFFHGGYYEYFDKETSRQVFPDSVFGVVRNGGLYVYFNKDFYKVIIKGPVSLLNRTMTYYLTFYVYQSWGISMTEDNVFMVNFSNGEISRLNLANLREILKHDEKLYTEFAALSKSKQRKSLYPYLLKYNSRNPLLME